MKRKSPSEDRLILELNAQDDSKKPHKPKGFNREKILEELALKWHSKGLYVSPSRAMIALLEEVR